MLLNGTTYHDQTPLEVAKVLEQVKASKTRIRIWYGKDGISWNEENDIMGYIGRSTGTYKIPLMINNRRSMGGGGLLDHCIVKIQDIKSKRVLYQHPNFSQAVFTFTGCEVHFQGDAQGKPWPQLYARCKSIDAASRLSQFMNGERFSK